MVIGIDISVLNDKQRKGIGVYTYELVKALLKEDRQNQYILFGIATFSTFEFLKNIEFSKYPNVKLKIFKLPAKLFRTIFLLWQKFDWPPIEYFIGPIDIYYSFNWYLPPQRSGKSVATIFDLTPVLYPNFHQEKTVQLDKIRLERIKKYANFVITISENSKKDFLKFAPKKKVEVIYPATNIKIMKNPKHILDKYGLKPGYFLSVATLEPRKNIKGLIETYLSSGLSNKLVLVGGVGWKSEEIKNYQEKYPKRIILTGFVPDEDLSALYCQALCLVYPSFYEGFGLPLLEAMACGIPVITSNVSSLPEAGGKAALYIDPYNLDSLKKALIEISGNKDFRDKLIKEGFKQVKKFSWQKSAKKLSILSKVR